jgi:hypothetical protein
LVFEKKNANFFAENLQKSPKIAIMTPTPVSILYYKKNFLKNTTLPTYTLAGFDVRTQLLQALQAEPFDEAFIALVLHKFFWQHSNCRQPYCRKQNVNITY